MSARSISLRSILVMTMLIAAPTLASPTGDGSPTALGGADPVALIGGRDLPGLPEITAAHGRFNYQFATEDNRKLFLGDPGRYAIQRDGECAAMPGTPTDGRLFRVHDGRIYAFGSAACRERFVRNPAAFLDPAARRPVRNVAIFLFPGVELLDFAGPGEVFAAATDESGQNTFHVYTVAATREPLLSEGFVTVTPQYTIADCPRPAIIVVPGGNVSSPLGDPRVIEWIKRAAPDCDIVMSVCNGARMLGAAGLLDSLRVTTHHGAIANLRKAVPSATVLENVRYVDNGRIITTAGVSAGIDGALHVVDRLHGRSTAEQTARYMEYDWRPQK